ncbi:MAG TPA: sulfur carrier protein ThiS [Bacteroidales bacterium]|jgi:thiazole synthase/sulfur carrier protein|nr:sulfur carrier protein ThiS [Bacteroidales bacterium]MDI9573662.1 sulfur carrier protein ThiS [Bacteroidota bacterium]OQC62030.1 MAG: sulfur carrier protein ThiS [Bacteroidetes bacterium ADurb.Bin012]MBP9511008.1 sulfur carrier protein ThiS [Bacteroidales bacterium]MBP9587708.1 sulfur carrier protein ThiS [Bacteroidales bacterium]
MKIILNHKEETIDADTLTLAELIRLKKFTFRILVTKVNGRVVKAEDRDNIWIKDGDNVEVIHLISGG